MSTALKLKLIQGGKQDAAPSRKRAKREPQEDQFPVRCTRAPTKHGDLRDLAGLLTIEFRRGRPWEATFDPDDESIDNVIIPVNAVGAKDMLVIISSDSGRWVFEEIVRP